MATIKNLQQQLELINHNPDADCDRELSGCYIGDLLSWVMAHAFSGCVWITIMSNINVAAVASPTHAACVIMAEGVQPDQDLHICIRDRSISDHGRVVSGIFVL